MFYFSNFPEIKYNLEQKENSISVTDITRRFTIRDILNKFSTSYFEYYVRDGERPDTVAYDYYEDERLDWLVLLINEIHDPYFSWTMSVDQFNQYIRNKYGSIQSAHQQVHHYEKIINNQSVTTNLNTFINIPERTVVVDYQTYAGLTASGRKQISSFDFEFKVNEDHRLIYLLNRSVVPIIKNQFPTIFENTIIR